MILEIKIPSPGESITEAQLATWLVKDGDFVVMDQELAEIESDKATLPLIAGNDGQIKLLIQAGDTVKIGAVACTIDTSAERPEKTKDITKSETSKQEIVAPLVTYNKIEKSENYERSKHEEIKVTPVAHKMMEENNLSLEDIIIGLKRIGKAEVEIILKNGNSQVISNPSPSQLRDEEHIQVTPLRKKLGEKLVAAKNQTAMLTTFNEVDMSQVIGLRKKYQQSFESKHGIKIGFMSFFTKAVVQALKLHPNVNSRLDGGTIIVPRYFDIAIAVQTDKGLMVPVLRNVENMSLAKIEHSIAELATKARSGRISIEEMTGGTFTITNGGIYGSMLSTPIINPPQSAILGMHNILDRPVAIDGKVEIRPVMYVALSYDHRIIDGKDSVGCLVHIKKFIENPLQLLFDGKDPEKLLFEL
jgi:2-oxoglutarate dehydrogenase E2 component (dihydrolipoamide succinyltransferase)